MWGKTRPIYEYSRVLNPYDGVPDEQIFRWVERGFEILDAYRQRKKLWFIYTARERSELAKGFLGYYKSEAGSAEVDLLKRIGGPGYRAYHNVAASPLLITLGDLLYNINILCRRKTKTADILLDNVEEYTGFDALSASRLLQEQVSLEKIETIKKLNVGGLEYRDHPLLQAIDLRLFFYNKSVSSNDPVANAFLSKYPEPKYNYIGPPYEFAQTLSNEEYLIKWNRKLATIRYQLGYMKAIEKSPYLAKHMIEPEEFVARSNSSLTVFLKKLRHDPNAISEGILILKDD